jgi:PAS domain S-box-containing protein
VVSGLPFLALWLTQQKLAPTSAFKFLALLTLIAGLTIGGMFVVRYLFRKVAREIDAGPDLTPKAAPDQQSAFVVATFQQVIQRMKEQEKELERLHREERQRGDESQQRTAAILKHLPTGVVVMNPRGQITECNPAAQLLLGHQLLVGRNYREILWPEYRAGQEAPDALVRLETCLREGKLAADLTVDYRAPGEGGPARRLGLNVSPVPAAEGASGGAICLLTSRSGSEGSTMQDLKKALADISGEAAALQSSGPEESRAAAGRILREVETAAALLENLLAAGRVRPPVA